MSATLSLPMAGPVKHPAPQARWLSVVSHTDPRYGGLSSAVPRSGRAVSAWGPYQVSLAAFCAPGEETRPEGYDEGTLSFWPTSRVAWLRDRELRDRFARMVRSAEGVHIHGLWEASTAVASRTARKAGKPYLVSAHGMLEPWALANKRWKKKLYGLLVERKIVARAACLHALTTTEAAQYRSFGAKGPIAVIPNAVEVPEQLSAELFLNAHPELRDKRVVLFLGRLHPKKGLDLLVDAWARIWPHHPEAHLVLAGPDSENTAARLAVAVERHNLGGCVTFVGMLDAPNKWSALAAAECFVLPSFSEGLSMGILEALGAGVPVIVTRTCNMPEVTREGAGWEIEPEVGALAEALGQMLERDPEENSIAGRRGAALVTTRYNPRHIAQVTTEVYEYVAGGIPPRNVLLL